MMSRVQWITSIVLSIEESNNYASAHGSTGTIAGKRAC
jgi:hypothetical protein